MRTYIEKLKYTGELTTVTEYDSGLLSYAGIDVAFRNDSYRNKVICRLDCMYYLTQYFKEETITKYRDALYMIISRQITDVNTISDCFMQLCKEDSVFADKLYDIYHFYDSSKSFGDCILDCMSSALKNFDSLYRNFFRGKKEFVIALSDGYLYFSVQDEDYPVRVLKGSRCEVLSYAKNWSGKFEYV